MSPNKKDILEVGKEELIRQKALSGRLYCCASTGCLSSGCQSIMDNLQNALNEHDMSDSIEIVPTGCMGLCSLGPLVKVELNGKKPVLYKEVSSMLARLMVAEHLIPGMKTSKEFELPEFLEMHTVALDIPFFKSQEKVLLANAGSINPESIEQYIAKEGYEGFKKALKMGSDAIIDEMIASGLRGRGGGGYPTGLKWKNTLISEGDEKFIICNGDEGDPGAYMDRSILEGDPHAVLEGMLIAAHATGATSGWFYIRAEYPLAIERVEKAIRQAKKYGLLGKNILGSDFSFTCEIRLGAGAFVCGEETALIASIEGKRGTPNPRPPYPSQSGLWDQPSCVNTVETLANAPLIIRKGAKWFSAFGTKESRGTKVFALTGKVKNSGLIEVPMGISLRDIVEKIGGGVSTGKPLKAVQTGGPSGGVVPISLMDTQVCYDRLQELGSIMGSGGMIVMDEDDSMVDIAAFYLEFTVEESCGKCAPCRIGGKQMLELLKKIAAGEGTLEDLKMVKRLAKAMQKASLCGLGQTAPNPVVSTLKYFEQEYMDKLLDGDK